MTRKKFHVDICSDCGFPGNCTNPKKCAHKDMANSMYCDTSWQKFQADFHKDRPDSYDDITWAYYLTYFVHLIGKGVSMSSVVITYPAKWIWFDLLPDAMDYAISCFSNHEDSFNGSTKPRKKKKSKKEDDDFKPGGSDHFDESNDGGERK